MKNTMMKRQHSFVRWQARNWKGEDFFPPELEYTKAIDFLVDYLLGEHWYYVNPVKAKQGNVYIVHEILMKYSKQYRKELKRYRKRMKRKAESK